MGMTISLVCRGCTRRTCWKVRVSCQKLFRCLIDVSSGMNLVNPSPLNSAQTTPIKNPSLSDQSPTSDYIDESSFSAADSSNSSVNSPVSHHGNSQRKHPHNVPYNPLIHTSNKPPYSFSCLIFMAIEDSEQKALPVKEIYAWILGHFPYFRNAPTGWKNSVRHNLSLNKCFQKVEKAPVSILVRCLTWQSCSDISLHLQLFTYLRVLTIIKEWVQFLWYNFLKILQGGEIFFNRPNRQKHLSKIVFWKYG